MNFEKEDIIVAFEKTIRNRYFKLFDYYKEWFLNKDYLAIELAYKIGADLGINMTHNSIKYVRSRVMKKRITKTKRNVEYSSLSDNSKSTVQFDRKNSSSLHDFVFHEPKSIDHNKDIVTIRPAKTDTN